MDVLCWVLSRTAAQYTAEAGIQLRCWSSFLDWLAELSQKLFDATHRAAVSLSLASPSMVRRILDQFEFAGAPGAQTRRVFIGGDEFSARQVEVAFTWTFLRQPQAVAQFELGLEEVRFDPIHLVS
jgi:hypothetical protein